MDAIAAARDFPGHVLGRDDAPVTVIEYADFQCPGCKMAWLLTVQDVKDRLVADGTVRFIFRDFPLDMHNNARPAHHAAACADEQGQFWAMHDQLFANQDGWSVTGAPERMFRDYAEGIGLDTERYDACMAEGRYRGRIQASYDSGVELGVSSTPTMIVGNSIYSSLTYDQLKGVVDSLIASTS
jgi:protein-disulfide isomerase